MKRKNNLYENCYNINNIMQVYKEVCKNTKNKKKVRQYQEFKCIYIYQIYETLKNRGYKTQPYVKFTIYEPKERKIVSQNMFDKMVNHLVARYILYPAILPCLLDYNVASRKGLGTKAGLQYFYNYNRICDIKYEKYYILKCDISKFFASINHDILKQKLKRRIKDKEALDIVGTIIDSYEEGLGIGNMTSQVLAIFYLNDLDHYIKEELKIKYYVRYQDDFLLYHPSKEYLRECLNNIIIFLEKEKLELNRKTRLYSNREKFIFLGRKKNGRYANYRTINKKIKYKYYQYKNEKISLNSFVSTIRCYQSIESSRDTLKKLFL